MSLEEESVGSGTPSHGPSEDEEGLDEEEDEDLGDEEAGPAQNTGKYGPNEVNDQVFDELELEPEVVAEIQEAWALYLRNADSREAAGEAIYAALFDAAPNLQSLFKTPRAVMAMRFMAGVNSIIGVLGDTKSLKTTVETLGFQHMDLEVTIPRICVFRDAIVDLLALELGPQFSNVANDGLRTVLNYVGGSYVYVRVNYASRFKILGTSWATANNRKQEEEEVHKEMAESGEGGSGSLNEPAHEDGKKGGGGSPAHNKANSFDKSGTEKKKNTSVPTCYPDMFRFNAAVMGFGGKTWMNEVLASFDTMVTNVSNVYRLQEECDILSLRLAKCKGQIVLTEYKAVMLASLRSLVPKDWDSDHEVAWSWLWENVEQMLKAHMGKPAVNEQALSALWSSLTPDDLAFVRREVYVNFFTQAPSGMDHFKQSTTRLHFIADKVVSMSLEMYHEPDKMVNDLSAMGLRHVGYGIPTELFSPFVSSCVQVVRTLTEDDVALGAFRWSLNLISRILCRVITEGSTIVMRAINENSAKQLRKAVGCAPRSKRSEWMLNITVGTESISPLMRSISTGSLDAAEAIIMDLLTIRADRDRYYYGADALFSRHPDIIKRLSVDAPALLPTLLDGLIWRSRLAEHGRRRVNYFISHLLVGPDGDFAQALEWIMEMRDPKLVCHDVVSLVTDLVWGKLAFRTFLIGKSWLMFCVLIFTLAQAILNRLLDYENPTEDEDGMRVIIFILRIFIYGCSMTTLIAGNCRSIIKDYRNGNVVKVGLLKLPGYLFEGQALAGFILCFALIAMLCTEPIIRCLVNPPPGPSLLFTQSCMDAADSVGAYSSFSLIAILCYYMLLTDLSVFSTRVSAFALILGRVVAEVGLFLFALAFIILGFASGISALDQEDSSFDGIPTTALTLLKVVLGMAGSEQYETLDDHPILLITVVVYIVVTVIFMLNLLIAQLNCSYAATFQDMLGFARLKRGTIVVEAMVGVAEARWNAFVESLELDQPCEFGEGDIGFPGGISMTEPANANITTVDMIRRFGGSTSPSATWPEDTAVGDDQEDRFDKVEKLIKKTMKKLDPSNKRRGGGSSSQGASSAGGGSSLSGSGSQMSE